MSTGKIAAQVAHAALEAAEACKASFQNWYRAWKEQGQKKVVLQVPSEEALLSIYEKARALGLPVALIRDRGLTELPPGTITCVGIGPAPSIIVDRITGELKLL